MRYAWFERVHLELRGPARSGRLSGWRDRWRRVIEDARLRDGARNGALAGAAAGVLLSAVMLVLAAAQAQDLWGVVKFAGVPFLGERALQPGADGVAALIGFASHLAVSAGWGAVLGVLVHGASAASTFIDGAAYGVVVWLVMHGFVVPRLLETAPTFDWTAIALHVLFGVATAGALVLARLSGRTG